MVFQYRTVLMIGATSGIGLAMANRLVHEGFKVIAVGRRQDRLDAFVKEHGPEKSAAAQFDITDRAGMDGFIKSVTTSHPDIDCVFLNAGNQHPITLSDPPKTDLSSFHSQINTNFTCVVDLAVKFLPFLQSKKDTPTSLIFTSSHLAFIPATGLSAYCASKAALNSFILCLRDEVRESNVKVVEIWPPIVQTELHDYRGAEAGRSMGMPVDKFTDLAYEGLARGQDQVTVGGIGDVNEFNDIVGRRRKVFDNFCEVLRKMHG